MTDGYAARPGGTLSLFHALLIMHQLNHLPAHFAADLDYVRLTLDLTDREFEDAVDICVSREWIRFVRHPDLQAS